MAIAGRVAIVPKGEWSQSVTYDKLDLVTYNGNTFIAYKSSVGVEPVDGDTWMLVMQGIDPQDIENIIDGTTPVGNSNKLGGKEASEYALAEEIKDNSLWNALTEGFDLKNALGNYRTSNGSIVTSLLNRPSDLSSGEITVEWFPSSTSGSNLYGMQVLKFSATTKYVIYFRMRQNTVWSDWKTIATLSDLANYLPIGGGMLLGDLYVNNGYGYNMANSNYNLFVALNEAKNLEADHRTLLIATSKFQGIANALQLQDTVNGKNTNYDILHTGNKPSGEYTGTGATTSRSITVGGITSGVLHVTGGGYSAFVTQYGATVHGGNSVQYLPTSQIKYIGGVLTIATASALVNSSGTKYGYSSL